MELCDSDDGNARTEVDSGGSITKTLSNAGQSLEGTDAELVLIPLRLAFETKNPKVIELALDCIHVCHFLFDYCSSNFTIIPIRLPNNFVSKFTFFTSCSHCKCRNLLPMTI